MQVDINGLCQALGHNVYHKRTESNASSNIQEIVFLGHFYVQTTQFTCVSLQVDDDDDLS